MSTRTISPAYEEKLRAQGYVEVTCSRCGEKDWNSFTEPHRTHMVERQLCFGCDLWFDRAQEMRSRAENGLSCRTIIEHHLYTPGERTSGSFRGLGGRRFDIEYIPPSKFAGEIITCRDLWSAGKMPEYMWEEFPDTAKFHDAGFVKIGEVGAWNNTPNDRNNWLGQIVLQIEWLDRVEDPERFMPGPQYSYWKDARMEDITSNPQLQEPSGLFIRN
jgi:hypothetical protein